MRTYSENEEHAGNFFESEECVYSSKNSVEGIVYEESFHL